MRARRTTSWCGSSATTRPPTAPHQRVTHWDIGAELGILDLERGAKLSGSMFVMYRGAGASLVRALCQLALDRNSDAFEEIRPPTLVLTDTMVSTGHLPKFVDDAYHLERDDLWAIPTAEVPLTSLARDEILDEADLPMRLMAHTSCFRREAGSAGRDTRGLLRVHEFDKVEILAYATPDAGAGRARRAAAAGRGGSSPTSASPTGSSTSAPATWATPPPAPSTSRSTRPASTAGSRCRRCRGSATTRPGGPTSATGRPRAKGTEVVHTLNGSALAVPRVWAALVETWRRPDGQVAVPEVLRPYLGGRELLTSGPMVAAAAPGLGARVITTLDILHPDPAELVGEGNDAHPMRQVTRQVAFEPGGWTPERAAKVAALFDGLAPEWHTRIRPGEMVSLTDALERGGVDAAVAASGPGLVVELGSGTGFGTPYLCERYGRVVAVDLSLEMLRHAGAGAPRVQADAARLPLGDRTVAALVLVNTLLFPAEVERVVAPGGVVVWVNSLAERTPIHLPADDVARALPGRWDGVGSRAGGGSWCVLRRCRLISAGLGVDLERLAQQRRSYGAAPFDLADAAAEPFEQFARWFDEVASSGLPEVNAAVLATATRGGPPLRPPRAGEGRGPEGFVLYTNYGSRKAAELDANPWAALVFAWSPLGRQVVAEGPVERVAGGGERRVLRLAAPRQPARRLGVGPVHAARLPSRARRGLAGRRRPLRGRARAPPAALGRLPPAPGAHRVLAGPAEPPARPDRLHGGPGGWERRRLAP